MTTHPTPQRDPFGSSLKVRSALMALGWKSMAHWATTFGHKPVTAGVVVRTWWHRADRIPHGGLSRLVMADLRATLRDGTGPDDMKNVVTEVKFAGNARDFLRFLDSAARPIAQQQAA